MSTLLSKILPATDSSGDAGLELRAAKGLAQICPRLEG
jgi:hypothetical protein